MPSAAPPSGARSLADDIRGRSDAQLADLVLARTDLARPAPSNLTSLAARAATRASVQRCVDSLDLGHLQVLEAVVVAEGRSGRISLEDLVGGVDVSAQLRRLWELALVWRASDGLYAVRSVPEVLGPYPAGLGPPLAELDLQPLSPSRIRGLLADAPNLARTVLDRLTWGSPIGVVGRDAAGWDGVRWLVTEGLLQVVSGALTDRSRSHGETRVVLPREVALVLRGGRLYERLALEPPPATVADVGAERADAAAGAEVSGLLALVEEVVTQWAPAPPRVLRTGGLAVRDLRRLAASLDLDVARTAWAVELMYAADLVADDGELSPVWAPTPTADEWLAEPPGRRWVRLASGWLTSTRAAHLVGTRMPGASGPANALGPDVHWPPVRTVRADVLAELASLEPGQAETQESVVARLHWRRPLRSLTWSADTLAAVLREAQWLGLTGRGSLTSAGRALLADGADAAAEIMGRTLPAPVDQVLVQADLTAIAPGPLGGDVARLMRLAADVESRGGATVHRFTPTSVRRALDAGWTADELVDALRAASRTGVPQPLDYLVRDVARQHGRTRVGRASAYVRSDDDALLESLLVERSLGALRLRRIAPSVLVSPADPELVVELLREAGHAPVQEGPDGAVVVPQPVRRRAPGRRPTPPTRVTSVDRGYAASLVRALRAAEDQTRAVFEEARSWGVSGEERSGEERSGEERPGDARPGDPRAGGPMQAATEPAVTLAALLDAVAEQHPVWVGYADVTGRTERFLFYPTRVEGGRAWGHVAGSGTERALPVSRITRVDLTADSG